MNIDMPLKAAIGCALAVLLSGCVDKASPDNVDKRAVERWNYLIAHQAEKAYDYLTPGFRSTITREDYAGAMNNRPVQWSSAEFKSKECDQERCLAQVDVTYSVTMPGTGGKPVTGTRTQQETWLFVDGEWFFLPSE